MKKIGLVLVVILVLGLCALNLRDMLGGVAKLPGGEKARVVLETMSGYDTAYAATTTDITITVTCRYRCVSASGTSFAFGGLDEGVSVNSTPAITVTNCGNLDQTFKLAQRTPVDWAHVIGTPATDEYKLSAMFRDTASGTFAADDVIGDAALKNNVWTPGADIGVLATTAVFSDGGAGNGVGVPGPTGTRSLWFRITTPTPNTTTAQQSILVRIRADVP